MSERPDPSELEDYVRDLRPVLTRALCASFPGLTFIDAAVRVNAAVDAALTGDMRDLDAVRSILQARIDVSDSEASTSAPST